MNRFFDELACNRRLYEQFRDRLYSAFPEAGTDFRIVTMWVKNYLYMQLKPTVKMEILPTNENVRVRNIPAALLEKRAYWVSNVLDINDDDPDGSDEINLYVSLGENAAVDSHTILNTLDILISTPGSKVHLKKIYKVNEPSGNLAGMIDDNTFVSRSTELAAAAHAFLNYSKTDMLVKFWENSNEHDERISTLVYAARHVDVGISMCNILEVQEGIQMLRELSRDDRPWTGDGTYGLLFGIIAGCVQADYGPLLKGDGAISFIELIKWAYRHQLYQQVLTLIESRAPENLVDSGIFYYCDDEQKKEEITNLFARQRLELKPYEYYKMDDVSHYFIKSYDRVSVKLAGAKGEDRSYVFAVLRSESIRHPNPRKICGRTACSSTDTVRDVLYAYYHLGDVRNNISHGDATTMEMVNRCLTVSKNDVSPAMLLMRESIELFISSYEKALEEVQGKNPKIVYITSDQIWNAADSMKRAFPGRDGFRPPREDHRQGKPETAGTQESELPRENTETPRENQG